LNVIADDTMSIAALSPPCTSGFAAKVRMTRSASGSPV
jgi:hypothetical protein